MIIKDIIFKGKSYNGFRLMAASEEVRFSDLNHNIISSSWYDQIKINEVVYTLKTLYSKFKSEGDSIKNMCSFSNFGVNYFYSLIPRPIDVQFCKTIEMSRIPYSVAMLSASREILDISDYAILWRDGSVYRFVYLIDFLSACYPVLGNGEFDSAYMYRSNDTERVVVKLRVIDDATYRTLMAKEKFICT